MANVVRLVNGGQLQVRTGVIQGIGPQGPRGVAGPQGMQGEMGPVGPVGPIGQILNRGSRTDVASVNPLPAGQDVTVNFGSVTYDDISCFTSAINCFFTEPGDVLLSMYLGFSDAAQGSREIWFQTTGNVVIARKTIYAETPGAYYLDLSFPFRAAGTEVVNVHARSSTVTQIATGSWCVTRLGSGPKGDIGPQGIQGPVGATGAQGPIGPVGPASAGFPTYSLLLPH